MYLHPMAWYTTVMLHTCTPYPGQWASQAHNICLFFTLASLMESAAKCNLITAAIKANMLTFSINKYTFNLKYNPSKALPRWHSCRNALSLKFPWSVVASLRLILDFTFHLGYISWVRSFSAFPQSLPGKLVLAGSYHEMRKWRKPILMAHVTALVLLSIEAYALIFVTLVLEGNPLSWDLVRQTVAGVSSVGTLNLLTLWSEAPHFT